MFLTLSLLRQTSLYLFSSLMQQIGFLLTLQPLFLWKMQHECAAAGKLRQLTLIREAGGVTAASETVTHMRAVGYIAYLSILTCKLNGCTGHNRNRKENLKHWKWKWNWKSLLMCYSDWYYSTSFPGPSQLSKWRAEMAAILKAGIALGTRLTATHRREVGTFKVVKW